MLNILNGVDSIVIYGIIFVFELIIVIAYIFLYLDKKKKGKISKKINIDGLGKFKVMDEYGCASYISSIRIFERLFVIQIVKKHELTNDEKWYNNEISKVRIAVEHINAYIKKFKIASTRFRNRRKNFKLYMSLICGIYNFEASCLWFTDRPNMFPNVI